jgi:nucleoside-diphosphate-sugar epimerase
MNVHQRQDIGETFDERTPLEPPAVDDYGKNKLAAEQAVRAAVSGALSAIILRPTRIYGPFSKTFTVRPLQALAQGRFAVGGDPDVPANMVYVDNVVDAIAHALVAPPRPADDNSFLITDPDQLTLRGFYEFFGQRVGGAVDVVAGDPAGAPAQAGFASRWIGGARTIALSPEVRGLVRRILETEPIGTWPRRVWDTSPGLQARALKLFKVDAAVVYRPAASEDAPKLVYRGEAARVSSAKAMKDLGYAAPVSLDRALALTLAWAEYARLVPAGGPGSHLS